MVAKRVINLPGMTEFVEWLRISATAERNISKRYADGYFSSPIGPCNASYSAIAALARPAGGGGRPPISQAGVRSLFDRLNDSLATFVPKAIATCANWLSGYA